MTPIQVAVSKGEETKFQGDVAVVFVYQDKNKKIILPSTGKTYLKRVNKLGDFEAKSGQLHLAYSQENRELKKYNAARICFVGCGQVQTKNNEIETAENYRDLGGKIAQKAKSIKAKSLAVFADTIEASAKETGTQALAEGILLGSYVFNKYKKPDLDNKETLLKKLTFYAKDSFSIIKKGVLRGENSAISVADARDMANEPGNLWTPAQFAQYAQDVAKETGIECTVFDKKKLQSMKMGGILAVNAGSQDPPKLIVLDYVPEKYTQTIMFVGKGLTFDSGGVSLKPAAGMQDMKYDMCGGAAVLASMRAIAKEKPAVRVVGIVPSTDNMMSGAATKPGDIITHYNGLTSEVINTDAEGRLILADALAYGNKHYQPDCIIDLATLTGAVIIALGHHHTGLFSNNDKLSEMLAKAGDESGEPLWRLPLGKEYSKQLDSDVADIKNVGGREGGSITAACYLEKFVDDTPWAHMDIAGTAWDFTKKSYIPKGPSGNSVRTLVEFVRNWKKTKF